MKIKKKWGGGRVGSGGPVEGGSGLIKTKN